MTKLRILSSAIALSAGLAVSAAAQDADTVVATVGDKEITLGHMIVMAERLPQQYQRLDDRTLFDGVLEQLVQQTALGMQADGLTKRGELTLDNERRALLATHVIEKGAAEGLTEKAVQKAYDAAYGDAEPTPEFNAAHILVETEEEANALIEELDGGADFAELAKEHSTGPSGPSGGALGWFGPGAMVPAFDKAVQDMEVGEIAGPIETQFGWHVVKLNDTREKDAPSLEEVRGEIEGKVQQKLVEQMIDSATDDVEVTMPEEGAFDPSVLRDGSILDQ